MDIKLNSKSCFVCKHVPIWKNFYCGLKGNCKKSNMEILYDDTDSSFHVNKKDVNLFKITMCIHWEEN